MQHGTETLVAYDTTITFTNKPINLNFYSDSQKTKKIILENNRYMNFNGFISLTDNKKIDIPVYWEWPLETGNTEQEIEDNDAEDTTFIGKTMSMQIATTGMQVTSNPYENAVASTTINGVVTRYNSVQDAINVAGSNQGAVVTLLKDTQENILIRTAQDIVLNMNEKNLFSNKVYTVQIESNASLTITGGGRIKGEANLDSNVITINNYGELNLYGNTAIIGLNQGSGTGRGINNRGIVNINGGNISGKSYGIVNQNPGKINIYSNSTISSLGNASGTTENAIITIYGGTISYIFNYGNGRIIDYR